MCSNWRNCAKKKKKKDEKKHLKKKSSLHKQHHRLSVEPVGGEITVVVVMDTPRCCSWANTGELKAKALTNPSPYQCVNNQECTA